MTITGTLSGAPTGSTVSVTYTGTNIIQDRTATLTTTTDASGAWTTSLALRREDQTQGQGTWTVTSSYAGDSTHAQSSAGPCSVAVAFPPS
jgi:Flp pilus assembly protein CpaB